MQGLLLFHFIFCYRYYIIIKCKRLSEADKATHRNDPNLNLQYLSSAIGFALILRQRGTEYSFDGIKPWFISAFNKKSQMFVRVGTSLVAMTTPKGTATVLRSAPSAKQNFCLRQMFCCTDGQRRCENRMKNCT